MKINAFATASGVTTGRMRRAALWALSKTGRTFEKGGRYGGTDLTEEEQALCLQYIHEHSIAGGKIIPEEEQYEARRQGWLETWATAISSTEDSSKAVRMFSVYGCICLARDRKILDMAIDGARMGDLALEMALSVPVDFDSYEEDFFLRSKGFTAYLKSQGFESPGWGII